MNLVTDQYREILESIRLSSLRGGREDKRRAPRAAQRGRVDVMFCDGGDNEPVASHVRNFSSRGINILCRKSISPGQQFVASIPRKVGVPVKILYTVVQCGALPNHLFSIGAELTCVLYPPIEGEMADKASEMERIRKSILG